MFLEATDELCFDENRDAGRIRNATRSPLSGRQRRRLSCFFPSPAASSGVFLRDRSEEPCIECRNRDLGRAPSLRR
ncbi:hypothetical protein NL676_006053 [Syzygium grande]|nr:hypothetical protein NL676_006053 [Syzygium grande]